MILSVPELVEAVKNPNKAIIAEGETYSKKLRMHINSAGIEAHIEQVEKMERPALFAVRKKYTKGNKPLFARMSRPIDKVWSAKGGSIYYNLSESEEKKAIQLSNDVINGYSIKKWLEMFWQPHMLDDPFGVIFMEMLPFTEANLAKRQGRSFVYPTYKSIGCIHSYKTKGSKFEYIIFKLDDSEKTALGFKKEDVIYRVVDDAMDYLVKQVQSEVEIIGGDFSIPNYFGEVPAIRNSDLVSAENEFHPVSFFDTSIELADQFFFKGSVKIAHDLQHGFPKYAEFADDCPSCKGQGAKDGEECELCKGVGKVVMTNVSAIKALSWPTKDDVPIMPKEAGGYIEPSEVFHRIASEGMAHLENMMVLTIWGKKGSIKTQGTSIDKSGKIETATEVMNDIKPEADRLHVISEMAELRHKFILDYVIRLQINVNYTGSAVNYGRRYILEGPDKVWENYSKARKDGAPQNVLDDLLNEYYDAKYMTDPVGLLVAKKLMYVEPFVHLTAQQLKGLGASEDDYKAKLYFSQWLSDISSTEIVSKKIPALRDDLYKFTSTKKLLTAEPPKEQKQIAA
jgi:hypothetical protein